MIGKLEPDGSPIADGILSPVGDDSLFPMAPSVRMMLMDLREDFNVGNSEYESLNEEIRNDIMVDFSDMALDGDRIGSAMRASAETDLIRAISDINVVNNNIVSMLSSDVLATAPDIKHAGMRIEYPDWERTLYDNLSRSDAYRVSQTMRALPGIGEIDRSVVAAQLVGERQAGMQDYGFNPVRQVPTVPNPVPPTPTCPPVDTLEECTGYGAAGFCKLGGNIYIMPEMPRLTTGQNICSPPTDAEMLDWRLQGYTEMRCLDGNRWDRVSSGPAAVLCLPGSVVGDRPVVANPASTTDTVQTTIDATKPIDPYQAIGQYPPECPVEPGCPAVLPPGTVVIVPVMTPAGPVYPPYPPNSNTPIYSPVEVNVTCPVIPPGEPTEEPDEPKPPPPPPPPPPIPVSTGCLTLDNPESVCGTLGILPIVGNPPGGPANDLVTIIAPQATLLMQLFKSLPLITDKKNNYEIAHHTWWSVGIDIVEKLTGGRAFTCNCDFPVWKQSAIRLGFAEKAKELTGIDIPYLFQDIAYAQKASCPQYLPEQAALDSMLVYGALTHEQWICYTRCHGNLPNTHLLAAELGRVRPGILDLYKLKGNEAITQEDYNERMKKEGVMEDTDRTLFEKAQFATPTVGDIIQFVQKDVAVEEIVAEGDLDSGFDESYLNNPEFVRWATAQGLTEEVVKYHYRASWVFPSNTQVYELLHRNRPGRVDEDLVFNVEDAERIMKINDIAPGMRPKLISISFAVPTRTDVKHAYIIESIDKPEVIEALQDNGYKKTDAEMLADIYEDEKTIALQIKAARRTAWTPKAVSKAFGEGNLNEADASQELSRLQIPEEQWFQILDSGRALAKSRSRSKCIRGVRRRYMLGELTIGEVSQALHAINMDGLVVIELLQQYECERHAAVKEVAVNRNINWYIDHIIDMGTLSNRLANLNYTPTDANLFIQEAVFKEREKRRKEDEKIAKQIQADIRRHDREQRQRHADLHHLEEKHGGPPVPPP